VFDGATLGQKGRTNLEIVSIVVYVLGISRRINLQQYMNCSAQKYGYHQIREKTFS
jgi:hypothetical protein